MNVRKSSIAASLLFILLFISKTSSAQQDSAFVMKPIGTEAFEIMRKFFDYDPGIPLESKLVEQIETAEYVREKIVFRGVNDSRVPGYLAIPKLGSAPYPCVLLLHGLNQNKEIWWTDNGFASGGELSKQLLLSGFAVLALDAEYHGERMTNNDYESPRVFTLEKRWTMRSNYMTVQTVREYRRVIDYLMTRNEIDTNKIGMIGYSMGGYQTFSLTAIEPRIKVSVACVTPIIEKPYSPRAAYHFAPYITTQPFLMLMGKTDPLYSMKEAQQLHGFIGSNTKELIFYDSGHQLPVEWTERAVAWMEKYLK